MDRDPGPVPIPEESPDQDMLVSYNTVPVPGVVCLVQHVLEQPGAGLDLVQCGGLPRGALHSLLLFFHHPLDQLIGLLQVIRIPASTELVSKVIFKLNKLLVLLRSFFLCSG
jgi:hypothetical protein